MTRDQMDFLHGIVAELLALPGKQVVWAQQNMPRLCRPFATLQIFGKRYEKSEELRPTGPGQYKVVVPMTCTLAVQYFGADAASHLETMTTGFSRPTIVDRCFAAKVAVYDAEGTTDLSGLLEGQTWEERAAVDLHVRFNSEADDAPGYIESVVIEADIEKHLPQDTVIEPNPDERPETGTGDGEGASSGSGEEPSSSADETEYYIDTVQVDGIFD
uniref:Phage neck terminator protein gp12-like domain-containing protein n=1 Tax=Myoviridae sp. ct17M4 TaxID=2825016 RepID=A0A8S5TVD0_9CAUD|nr:MAG TPA: hypothetical protein [Myoviridae sp. ct17M4]